MRRQLLFSALMLFIAHAAIAADMKDVMDLCEKYTRDKPDPVSAAAACFRRWMENDLEDARQATTVKIRPFTCKTKALGNGEYETKCD